MKAIVVLLQCSLFYALNLNINGTFKKSYFSPYFMEEGLKSFNVTAPFIIINDMWDMQDEAIAVGKIAVLNGQDIPLKFREDNAFRAMELGMVGVVDFTGWEPDHFGQIFAVERLGEINIPYVTISTTDLADLHTIVDTLPIGVATLTLLSNDSENSWPEVLNGIPYIVIFRAFLGFYAFVLAVLAVQKLVLWFQYYLTTKNYSKIAVLCLFVELFCCLVRAAYCAYGGLLGCRILSWPLLFWMFTGTLPLNYLTTALTCAYLHEVLTTKSPLGTMVDKTRKPLLGLSVFYVIVCWPTSIASSFNLYGSGVLSSITSGLLTIGTGVTAVLLLYITIRLGRYYKYKNPQKHRSPERSSVSGNKDDKAPPDRLKELVSRTQHSCFWLLWTTGALGSSLAPEFHTPYGWFVINCCIFLGLNTTSLLHILAYGKTPAIRRKSLTGQSSMDMSRKSTSPDPGRKSKAGPVVKDVGSPLLNIAATSSGPKVEVQPDDDHRERVDSDPESPRGAASFVSDRHDPSSSTVAPPELPEMQPGTPRTESPNPEYQNLS